jgi:hypothetical protein
MTELKKAILRSNSTSLRSPEISGYYLVLPKVGRGFRFFSTPFGDEGEVRVVTTSVVTSIESLGSTVLFTTRNSDYAIVVER